MIDTAQLETDAKAALVEIHNEIQGLRNQRKDINVRLAELDIEARRLARIANAFQPRRPRKIQVNGDGTE